MKDATAISVMTSCTPCISKNKWWAAGSFESIKTRRAGLLKFPKYHADARYQSSCDGLSRHRRQPPREARVPSIYSTIPSKLN